MTAFQKIRSTINLLIQNICTVFIILFFGTSYLTALTIVGPLLSFSCGVILSIVLLANRAHEFITAQLRTAVYKARPLFKKILLEASAVKLLAERRKPLLTDKIEPS
jgi:hypothetical protein